MSELFAPRGLYIGGEWVSPADGHSEEIINPATEEVLGVAPLGGMAELDLAIAAARRAFDTSLWPAQSGRERGARLVALHQALDRRRDDVIEILIQEAGATRMLAGVMFDFGLKHLRHFAGVAEAFQPMSPLPIEVVSTGLGSANLGGGAKVRVPHGVVATISAYNFPFTINCYKIAPALAVGCTVVLKPSPFTPFSALIIAEAAAEAGFPPGVINVVTGGPGVGEALTSDPRVDMVNFTGSEQVGISILRQAAGTMKRTVIEAGGKSALIVRADADLQQAALAGFMNFTLHAGQGCALTTRMIVHNSVRKAFVSAIQTLGEQIRIGNPADPETTVGPLIRDSQRRKVEHYVAAGLDSGARLVMGGARPGHLPRGYYFQPTLFDDVDNGSVLAQEEVFGPIGAVIGFDTDDEAVALANDSRYGLGGAIRSADTGRAFEMALKIRTGTVTINGGAGGFSCLAPFGGFKLSGIGREMGDEGLNEFTELKSILFKAG